jgi:hypothetical protein
VTVVLQLLTGRISTHNLLNGKDKNGKLSFSAGRAQMLIITLFGAMYYLMLILKNPSQTSFPPVPRALLQGVGASQLVYLALKAKALLFRS